MCSVFQSTLPRRERPFFVPRMRGENIFQSTLPQRERQNHSSRLIQWTKFQSTLPQRERPHCSKLKPEITDFNPRSRKGSDCVGRTKMTDMNISIHAPAKGATVVKPALPELVGNFNPRSREGSDYLLSFRHLSQSPFQSTLPRRERRCMQTPEQEPMNFNPRSREGSDKALKTLMLKHANFNPRSREGSDVFRVSSVAFNPIFQSTLPRRERQQYFTNPQVNIVKH